MFIRPIQQRIVIHTLMFTPFTRRICLSLQRHVRITHDALADIIEAMSRVMCYFFLQYDATVALLEVHSEVGEAVKLVEDRHHVCLAVVLTVDGCDVGFGKVVGSAVAYDDVASRF